MHHHVITIEQPMTDRQDTIECTGEKEKDDQAELDIDDNFVILIDKLSHCGHDKPPLELFALLYLVTAVTCF